MNEFPKLNLNLNFNLLEYALEKQTHEKEMDLANVRHKKNLFYFQEVALELEIQLRQSKVWSSNLLKLMESAAKLPSNDRTRLITREKFAGKDIADIPLNNSIIPPNGVAIVGNIPMLSCLTRPDDVNAWFEATGAPYRWNRHAALPLEKILASAEAASQGSATVPRLFVTKKALIKYHAFEWPSINNDLKDAKDNGLSTAAKAAKRGWHEDNAMQWARSKGKLNLPTASGSLSSVMRDLPSIKHRSDD